MKIFKILLISLISFSAFGQKSPVDAIFDKYSEIEGFTTVYISKSMFSLFANSESKNSQDAFARIISGLESIRILSVEDSILNTKINLYKELSKELPMEKYEPLMVIKEKNQDTRMLIRKSNGIILEFLMIGGGEDNFLISITGNLDLESIRSLSKTMDIKELENVDKLDSNTPN
jgi:hypothetical protein